MNRYGIKLLTLALLSACVPDAKNDVHNQSTNVSFVGSFSGTSGTTAIYFGRDEAPLAQTASAGQFTIEIPRALIEKSSDRRLYFYSTSGETAVSEEITDYEIGEKKLANIKLAPPLTMTGSVLAANDGPATPVADAEIIVGRQTAKTDAKGHYTIMVARNAEVAVLLHKEGFVQTRALWTTTDLEETRDFHLYNKLEPIGSLSIAATTRFAATRVPLYLESTPSAAYVRLGDAPFTTEADLDGTWQDLSQAISLSPDAAAQPNIYYQFADKDKKLLGPIQVFTAKP